MSVLSWSFISRGSSPVDWCEDNYTFSPHIAEFVNTVSNVLFFLMPPLLIYLHQPYARHVGPGIHLIWLLLIIVGISSAYFHATLSLLGQLLDEIAILWVVMAGFAMWCPSVWFPLSWQKCPDGRRKFSLFITVTAIVSTGLGFLQPAVNAFILLTLAVPTLVLLIQEIRMEKDSRVVNLGKRTITLWGLAVTCWVNDRLLCPWWASVGFPYLHGAWHILIFLASYTAVVLFAYFEVKNNMKWETPVIRYYPWDNFQLGVPYVVLARDLTSKVTNNNMEEVEWRKHHSI